MMWNLTFIFQSYIQLALLSLCSGYLFEDYLSTMTPYRTVSNNNSSRIQYSGCSAEKAWMVVRHGTRNAKASTITKMKERLPLIKHKIIDSRTIPGDLINHIDLDALKKWKSYVKPEDEKKLVHEGEEEMILLAERMLNRFPDVFGSIYSNTSYKFKYTFSQRTKKSAYYFSTGLFGKATAKSVYYPEPSERDPILRFYKLCDKWNTEIKKNPEAVAEKLLFMKGKEMNETVNSINRRLGLESFLSTDDVILMYHACAYETAQNKNSRSPWCAVFTVDDLKVLEYIEDLKMYWQDGYGYELTYKQACPAFVDMVNFLESSYKYPKVSVYFTHSGTLLKMLAHLGLYKDDKPLTASNFAQMSNRKWRTSKIDSFATNLAFILFRCEEDKVLTLHQEKIVRLPSCPDSDLCSLDQIKKYYFESIQNCNFEAICDLTKKL